MKVLFLFTAIIFILQANLYSQTEAKSQYISELPLKEFFTPGNDDYLVILFTGDGGWKSLALGMADFFNKHNISLVGLDVKKYFWTKRDQKESSVVLETLIEFYCSKWNKSKVVIIGYSFGAEVLPFAINELSATGKSKIKKAVLLAPGQKAGFEVTVGSMLDVTHDGLPIAPELDKSAVGLYFIVCDDSDDALCNKLSNQYIFKILKGGHHFDGDYQNIYQLIWENIEDV